ncbi:MAG TPA: hypothetical protein VLI54_03210 [Bacillota bacterium]|nr:hypothetical protein [Bacillota bacterium]
MNPDSVQPAQNQPVPAYPAAPPPQQFSNPAPAAPQAQQMASASFYPDVFTEPPAPQPQFQPAPAVQPQYQYQPPMPQPAPIVPQAATLPPAAQAIPTLQAPVLEVPQPSWRAPEAPTVPSMINAGEPPQRRSKKPFFITLAIIVLVAALAAAGFLLFVHKKPAPKTSSTTSTSTTVAKDNSIDPKNALDLATLQKAKFNPPKDLSALEAVSSATHTYVLKGASDKKSCTLTYGVYTAGKLPGTDISSIVQPQLDDLGRAGAVVSGPVPSTALIVRDGQNSKVTYSLPTLTYEVTAGDKHELGHYSAAILGNGDRAVVATTCTVASGAVDMAAMRMVDNAAHTITVTKQ